MSIPPKYVYACQAYLKTFNSAEDVDPFFEQLYTGKVEDGFDQVLLLRNWFIKVLADKRTKPQPVEYVAKILKAFKNFKEGKNPSFLRWHESTGESFPYDADH